MIVLISGTINSGKTTSARRLAKYLRRPAIVEIDRFFQFFPRYDPMVVGPDCVRGAAAAIRRLGDRRYNVIVPYPFWEKDLLLFLSELGEVSQDIFLATLVPARSIVLGARSKRKDKAWEKGVFEMHKRLGMMKMSQGILVDNSKQTVKQTVGEIAGAIISGEALIREGKGQDGWGGLRDWSRETRKQFARQYR